jgi:hypothetical protein
LLTSTQTHELIATQKNNTTSTAAAAVVLVVVGTARQRDCALYCLLVVRIFLGRQVRYMVFYLGFCFPFANSEVIISQSIENQLHSQSDGVIKF